MSTKTKHSQFILIPERCKGCGFCIEFCPQHIIIRSDSTNSRGYHIATMSDNDKCTGCNICSMICPDFAINVTSIREESGEEEG